MRGMVLVAVEREMGIGKAGSRALALPEAV
jgi:hypothetical protein